MLSPEYAAVWMGVTALVGFVGGYGVRALALRVRMVDVPDGERRTHARPVPLGGGLAAWFACVVAFSLLRLVAPSVFSAALWRDLAVVGVATLPLLVVGLVDDARRLSARWLVLAALAAVGIAVAGGIRVEAVTWFGGSARTLSTMVSVLVSSAWLLLATGATKFSDGVDGLVVGQTIVGAALIAGLSLSTAYFQPDMALIAGLFGAAFFGVLWHNWPRARLYLGEFGSTFSGFGLGVIAILSGAKLAIALAAVGVFLVDVCWVMVRRLWRGTSPFSGDRTHMHFLLQDKGWPSWAVAPLLWLVAFGFGFAALQLQTQGKIRLLFALALLTWGASFWLQRSTAASSSGARKSR
ncbi:undecaprenyl/decaprenyl-phosphate alpha-N-acetylglucosaminyl 1-phosphate transferase [Patescibacteria group bacterium]|nr:undecaprenyl/decaprenyl-phosphate alpha-N-acetylglucosaminyl 1-phosphate transferase [Patescibacteria group bacterium]